MGESWIVDMRRLMEQFNRPPNRTADMRSQEFEQSIYKVPNRLKDVNADAYMPKLVSLGPYHHGRSHLLPMENHKARACARFLHRLAASPEDVVSAMRSVVDHLLGAYGEAEEEEIKKEEFLRLMIVDGCFVLEVMNLDLDQSNNDYNVMDPVFRSKETKLIIKNIKRDMILLENQLPLLALYTLAAFKGYEIGNVNSTLVELFCGFTCISTERRYLHILDLYRTNMIHEHGEYTPSNVQPPPMTKLSYAGILLRPSMTGGFRCIRFAGRVLQLPQLKIHDNTESLLLNLMCFELMLPVAGNEVSAYAFFMEGIIKTSEDVVLLRKKCIIKGWLGYDDKVVNMFRQIIKEHMLLPAKKYYRNYDVSIRLNNHCERVLTKFRANFIHVFWKDPLSFSTFWLGVVVILVLTLIQTIFAILSYKQAQYGH